VATDLPHMTQFQWNALFVIQAAPSW